MKYPFCWHYLPYRLLPYLPHLLHIIREVLEYEPQSTGTDLSEALRYLTNALKKRCNAFVLSDLIDADADANPRYEEAIKVAANRHDISVVEVYDPLEREIPNVGLLNIKDSETGKTAWVDTGSRKVREAYGAWFASLRANEDKLLSKYNIDRVKVAVDEDYVKALMMLFSQR